MSGKEPALKRARVTRSSSRLKASLELSRQSQEPQGNVSIKPAAWTCNECTLENEESELICAACERPREIGSQTTREAPISDIADSAAAEADEEEEEADYENDDEDEDDFDGDLGASLGSFYDDEDAAVADLLDGATNDFDNVVGDAMAKAGRAKVFAIVESAMQHYNVNGEENVVILDDLEDADSSDNLVTVRAAIDISGYVDALTARIWGIQADMPIVLEFSFVGPHYTVDAKAPPKFQLFQSSDKDLSRKVLTAQSSFGLKWQLKRRLDEWLNQKDVWPAAFAPDGRNFVNRAMEHVVQRVVDCTARCIICDTPLPLPMVKPSTCDAPLCVYGHEEYGLGADVATEIRESSDVVDLLISLCYAASQSDVKRFNPFPIGVQAEVQAKSRSGTKTLDFMKEGWNKQIDEAVEFEKITQLAKKSKAKGKKTSPKRKPPAPNRDYSPFYRVDRVKEVLDCMPPVAKLSDASDTSAVKALLDSRNPLLFPLLRWIITSNRAYLRRLTPDEQINEMNTNMQYKFISSPPEKEARFQVLKGQHGSFWAFHGSQFSNWHSILRVGLKNYSGTSLMSTGAAFGHGIYLSPHSRTSSSYSRPAPGWPKSVLGGGSTSMTCICLCEVIKAGYKANPHYVIPVEEHVMTRYFFIYSAVNGQSALPEVDAKSLKHLKSADVHT